MVQRPDLDCHVPVSRPVDVLKIVDVLCHVVILPHAVVYLVLVTLLWAL